MNILIINGSPKGEKSNTFQITAAFIDGMQSALGGAFKAEQFNVSTAQIEHCRGCFCCWTATPGKCVIHDDMDALLPKIIEADVIIWSFPLYYYGMPSKVKALLDRNLPLNLPFITACPDGGYEHPQRHNRPAAKNVLISTCGFCSTKNTFEALVKQFDILTGGDYTKILCPEGELFSQAELRGRTEQYLSDVKQAGEEYARSGSFTKETEEALSTLLYPPQAFLAMANASWEVADETAQLTEREKGIHSAERFTKQMAATYNPATFDGTERVFEIYYTDVGARYQLVMGKERCEVRSADFVPYTTRVETPLTVWKDISKGVYSGEQAMMEGKYKTLGDLKLLMSWEQSFGGTGDTSGKGLRNQPPKKKTNMTLMIAAWFVIWTLISIHPLVGGVTGIVAVACVHFANLKWELTIYDYITCLCVSGFSLAALLGADMQTVVPLSYLFFGLMWLASCLTSVPLTAHYSKNEYNGDEALKNPLFMKTNRILTLCWGVLYLMTPIWTYYLMGSSLSYLTALINSGCPAVLGIFTAWFQRWYPAKIAGG